MESYPRLSAGAIDQYLCKGLLPPGDQSIFQVVATRPIQNPATATASTSAKFRLCLNDGLTRFKFGVLVLPSPDSLPPDDFSIIRLRGPDEKETGYTHNAVTMVEDKSVFIVGNFELLVPGKQASLEIRQNSAETPGTPSASTSSASSAPPSAPVKRSSADQPEDPDSRVGSVKRALFMDDKTCHISDLNQFVNKFVIKANVVSKIGPQAYSNSRGSGKFLNVILEDASCDIKLVGFDDLADRFAPLLKEDTTVLLSRARVQLIKDGRFNKTRHQYELVLTPHTEIRQCRPNDRLTLHTTAAHFDSLADLDAKQIGDEVNVIAVCTGVDEVQSVNSKEQCRSLEKRDLHLTDDSLSGRSVVLTVWQNRARQLQPDSLVGKAVCLRQVQVKEFRGLRNLNLGFSSKMQISPQDQAEVVRLERWFRENGGSHGLNVSSCSLNTSSSSGSGPGVTMQYASLSDLLEGALQGKDLFRLEAHLIDVNAENVMYRACPKCLRKVTEAKDEQTSGRGFKCDKCRSQVDTFNWRYVLRARLIDATDCQMATLFDSCAEKLIGMSANELRELQHCDADSFRLRLQAIEFQLWDVVVRVKMERWNDKNRLKLVVEAVERVNRASVSRRLRLQTQMNQMKKALET